MASRLSELSIKQNYEMGFRHISWSVPDKSRNLLAVDIDRILDHPDADRLVKSLPPQMLFHALKLRGPAESAAVLSLMSNGQMTRFLDYEAWQDDLLDPERALRWLVELSAPVMAERFCELEEEYQISLIKRYIDVYEPTDPDEVPDAVKDTYQKLPDVDVYYRVNTDCELVQAFFDQLVGGLKGRNEKYLVSLLAHAAFMPPAESEALLEQFRRARLEEDGFVTYDEALSAFRTLDVDALRARWSLAAGATNKNQIAVQRPETRGFLELTVERGAQLGQWTGEDGLKLQQGLLFVGNCLCTACHIEPDDLEGLNAVLENLQGFVGMGLEYLCGADFDTAMRVLKNEHPKILFQAGLSLAEKQQERLVERLCGDFNVHDSDKLRSYFAAKKWGQLLWLVDTVLRPQIGFHTSEVVKGILNRFPMLPVVDSKITFKVIGSLKDLADLTCVIENLAADSNQS